MVAKETTPSGAKDTRFARYAAFCAVWFVAVPLVGAFLLVSLLSSAGGTEAAGQGVLDALRAFGREQPVPVGIIAFTLIEMALWGQRHVLPGAGLAGVAGRADLPGPLRRRYEDAGALLDEAERIQARKRRDIERALPSKEREDISRALDDLREAMKKEPFDEGDFLESLGKAEHLVDAHLSPWRKSELREYTESIGIAVAVALLLRAFVVEAFKIPSPSMVPTLQVGDHIFVNKSAYGPMVPYTSTRLFAHLPPHYGDVIVFQFPEKPEQDFIKRVVALPGDKLEALDGRPIINGWRPPECKVGTYKHTWGDSSLSQHEGELFVEYIGSEAFLTFFDHAMSAATSISDRKSCTKDAECEPGLGCRAHLCGDVQGPYQVKPGEIWVMGDNRNNSHDSRGWWEGKGGGVPFDFIRGRALIIWMSYPQTMAWDRIGITVMGKPKIPPDQAAALQPALDKCFRDRPAASETTPPPATN